MSVIEHNAYRMAWGLLPLSQKQRIYKAMTALDGGSLAAQVIMCDMREHRVCGCTSQNRDLDCPLHGD